MKLLLPLLLLLTSLPSYATSYDVAYVGGTLAGSNTGLTLTGSTLVLLGTSVGDLGTVTFSTMPLISGSLAQGGTFGLGGIFTIAEDSAVVFQGFFDKPLKWVELTLANGTHEYTLTGELEGTLNGQHVEGVAVGLTVATRGVFDGSLSLASGVANLNTTIVPEPASLLMLGTGLGFTGWLSRKKARERS